MRFVLFILLAVFARAEVEICYVSEDYKRLETIFGHLFLAYENKAASFNLNSDLNLKDNLKALVSVEGILQILPRDKLIASYAREGRSTRCMPLNLSDSEQANLSALFYREDTLDTYSFFRKNCASALADYASEYHVSLAKSIIPLKFVSLNTNNFHKFYKFGAFFQSDEKADFLLTLLSLNDKYSHKLELFSLGRNEFSLIHLAEYSGLSLEFLSGIRLKDARVFARFFAGYSLAGFFAGFNNYGLSAGFLKDFKHFGLRFAIDKKYLNASAYIDFKNYRLSLNANKNYAKIGLIYRF